MVFAMPHRRCVSFTFRPAGVAWSALDEKSLSGFRATSDSDALVPCGPAVVEGETRKLTMCDPHPPPYLLDGMRLYSVATLDDKLVPIDRLKLTEIEGVLACR
jgi:hypothetical protein